MKIIIVGLSFLMSAYAVAEYGIQYMGKQGEFCQLKKDIKNGIREVSKASCHNYVDTLKLQLSHDGLQLGPTSDGYHSGWVNLSNFAGISTASLQDFDQNRVVGVDGYGNSMTAIEVLEFRQIQSEQKYIDRKNSEGNSILTSMSNDCSSNHDERALSLIYMNIDNYCKD
jgi:hypothetical protein